jgi:hypothetical protein
MIRKKDLNIGDKVTLKGNGKQFFVRDKHKPRLIWVSKTMECPYNRIYGVAIKDIKEIIS